MRVVSESVSEGGGRMALGLGLVKKGCFRMEGLTDSTNTLELHMTCHTVVDKAQCALIC